MHKLITDIIDVPGASAVSTQEHSGHLELLCNGLLDQIGF